MDIIAICILVLVGTGVYALSIPKHFAKVDPRNPFSPWQNRLLKLLSIISHCCALFIYRIDNPWVDTLLVFLAVFALCAPAILAFFSALPHKPNEPGPA